MNCCRLYYEIGLETNLEEDFDFSKTFMDKLTKKCSDISEISTNFQSKYNGRVDITVRLNHEFLLDGLGNFIIYSEVVLNDDYEKVGIGDDVYQIMLKYVLGIAEEVNKFDVMQFRIFTKDVDTDYLDGCITSAEEFV